MTLCCHTSVGCPTPAFAERTISGNTLFQYSGSEPRSICQYASVWDEAENPREVRGLALPMAVHGWLSVTGLLNWHVQHAFPRAGDCVAWPGQESRPRRHDGNSRSFPRGTWGTAMPDIAFRGTDRRCTLSLSNKARAAFP